LRTVVASALPVGTLQQVGPTRLFVDRRGEGALVVVFLPGAGLTGLDYWQAHARVSTVTTSVVYDRAGTGFSARVRLPRSSRAVTSELDELLRGESKVVLVGHSLGGIYARHFAARFPERIAGLVLLDPAHEDYDASMPAEVRATRAAKASLAILTAAVDLALSSDVSSYLLQRVPTIRGYRDAYRAAFEAELVDWPPALRDALVERHASLDWLAAGLLETRDVDALYAEIRSAGPLPPVPVVLLCSVGRDRFRELLAPAEPRERVQAERDARRRLYGCFVSALPRGEMREVDCGHVDMPFRQSDAIAAAVLDVAARSDGT
jgi:pimeloyl-ACP methyl ester carboxylesterase